MVFALNDKPPVAIDRQAPVFDRTTGVQHGPVLLSRRASRRGAAALVACAFAVNAVPATAADGKLTIGVVLPLSGTYANEGQQYENGILVSHHGDFRHNVMILERRTDQTRRPPPSITRVWPVTNVCRIR